MTARPPYLPTLDLPSHATTQRGELVRIRALEPVDQRVESASEYDDWGPFDIEFHDDDHGRAMVEVLVPPVPGEPVLGEPVLGEPVPGEPVLGEPEPTGRWQAVGDMSWHAEFHGPNLGSRAISIGMSLHVDARGRGIGTIAQSLLCSALHRAGVHRVEASTDSTNTAEQTSLERAGFVREGVLRGAQVRANGRHDLVLYSCLPGEPTVQPG